MAVFLGVFVARPYLVGTWPLLTLFIVLLVVGLAWPVTTRAERAPGSGSAALSLAVGIGAFGALSAFSNSIALFVHVLPKAASAGAAAVATAAQDVKLPVGTLANGGGIDIAPPGAPDTGNNRNAAGVIWEWVSPGHEKVVWPPAFATHPVVWMPIDQ
jgi:hypothetical protein